MPIVDIAGIGKVTFADSMSPEQITQAIEGDILPQFQRQAAEREKATGLFPAVRSGIAGLGGAYESGKYALGLGDREKVLAAEEKQQKLYQGPSWEETKQAYEQQGVLPGLERTYEFVKGSIGQSLPYMATPFAAGAAGTAIAGPVGGVVGAGLGSLAQFFGTNIGRQVQEQEAAIQRGEAPQELSRVGALASAAPQAAMDVFALGKIFKGTGLGKILGMEGEEAAQKVANKILKEGGSPSKLGAIGTGAARGALAEVPTEVAQQVLERAQAGLSLTGEDAFKEYEEAMAGAIAMGGPLGTFGGAAERKAGISKAEKLIDEARGEFDKEFQQRAQAQAALEDQNLALEQPQLPGMEMPAVTPYVQPEPAVEEAPAFELAPQGVQGELDLEAPEQPAPAATPTLIDTNYLKTAGLSSAVGLKAKGKNSIVGLDLNDPQQAAEARQKLINVGETTKSGKIAEAIETLLKTDTRLQEQPEMVGFESPEELAQLQVQKDQQDAELARQQRNQQYQQLLANLEAENAAKEEARAAGAGVPSEVRAEGAPGGLEPSVGVYEQPGLEGAPAGEESGGRALGLAGRDVEATVETTEGAGTPLDLAQLVAESEAEADRQIAAEKAAKQATPETQTDWEALLAAEGMPEDLEAIPTVEEETAAEAAARKRQERTAQREMEGELTGELSWEAGDADFDARQTTAPTPTAGMEKGAVQGIVDRLTQGWKRKVNVAVKNIEDETPGRQNALRAYGLDTAKGYIDHDGTVVILANNNANEADVAATLFHETLGHLGLRLKFKEELTNMMEKFYHTNADLKRAANKWLLDHKGEYDEKMPVNEKYAKAVEEVLAERAEAGRLPASIMDKIKAFINKWARRMGIDRDFSDAEIRAILDQAQQEITEKVGEAKTVPAKEIAPRSATATAEELFRQAGGDLALINRVEPTTTSKYAQKMREAATDPKAAMRNWLDTFETKALSSDAALQNEFRRSFTEKLNGPEAVAQDAINQLLAASTSQAVHDEAVGQGVVEKGGAEYNSELHKWVVKEMDASWDKLVKLTHSIGQKYGVDPDTIIGYAHTYLEANRLNGLREYNAQIEATAEKLDAKGKKSAAQKERNKQKYIHKEYIQIDAGLKLKERFPEFQQITDMWNETRKNVMDIAVQGGLYSKEDAKELLDIIDYVPFQRILEQEDEAGLRMFGRGLLIPAKEYAMKGSEAPVNNLFDNMEKWINYTTRRAVRNKSAQNLVKLMQDQWDGAREVPKAIKGRENNTIAIFQDGKRTFYDLDDPNFVLAFRGLDSMAVPSIKYFSTAANFVRQNIVLNPLFSLSQLPQDAFAAMLSSGLKHPWRLPLEVMKEFWKTLRGTSDTHDVLKAVGSVGRRDVTAATSRMDAEIAAGLRKPTKWQRLIDPLQKLSMASDNAVRQAIYNMTIAEGGSAAIAHERAFEIINFRRRGASGKLAVVGQVIPFFNAYLQAQNVAIKVISGRGIAPSTRKEAHKVLLRNSAIIATMSMLYAALMSDDDDYKEMDVNIRDKHWVLPGGLMIPMRTDLFSLPKILGEHAFSLITDQSYDDPAKARKAISDAFKNAILSPTVVPQGAKPLFEVIINKDIYRDRPIIGRGIENRETKEQYTASTSELAKLIGSTGLIAPVNVDHLLRGYLGTTGGLGMMATNAAIEPFTGVPRAEKTGRDFIASIPGLSTFVAKEFGAGDKNDYYELKKDVDKVVGTINYYKNNQMVEKLREYLSEEDVKKMTALAPALNHIQTQLAALRKRELQIANASEAQMTAEQKGEAIRQIREAESRLMANVYKYRRKAYD